MVKGLDEDVDDFSIAEPGDDAVDADYESDYLSRGFSDTDDDDDDEMGRQYRDMSIVRGMSEHIVESMEV